MFMKISSVILLSFNWFLLVAQTPNPDFLLEINKSSASFGASVSSAGDVNGDGFNDLIIGAKNESNGHTNEGAVYIYHGNGFGVDPTYAAKLEVNQMSATLGSAVTTAGDLNGDGYDDIAVAAMEYNNPTVDEGAVFIHYGSPTGINPIIGVLLESNQGSAKFGNSVGGGGDFNSDGYDDLVIGAFEYDNGQTNEGRVYIYMGSSTGLITTPALTLENDQANSKFGYAVDVAGDINGDGYEDIIIGAQLFDNGQTNEGRAYIYYGSASGITTVDAATIERNQANADFGQSVSGAGDVNSDGFDDVIIGAPYFNNGDGAEGIVSVYYGSATGIDLLTDIILEANQANAAFGWAVSECGDFDNDGYDDFLVGANTFDHGESNEGMAFLFRGSASGIDGSISMTFETNQATSNFANALSGASDLNNDGYDDLMIGAYQYDNGSNNEGVVDVYFGSTCSPAVYYQDLDEDDFGNGLFSVTACNSTPGFVLDDNDCNDTDPLINPLSVWYLDYDDDHYTAAPPVNQCESPGTGYVISGILGFGDCDDEDPARYDAAIERVDGIDNDCDGSFDEDLDWIFGGIIEGTQEAEFLGNCVSSGGDLNGDGFRDMIIATEGYDVTGDDGGIYIFHGSESGMDLIPETFIPGYQVLSYLGNSVSSAGDINNDGYDDIIAGAPLYTNGQFEEGRTFIYAGSSAGINVTPALVLEVDQANAGFGLQVANAGDINADGYDDVLVGAPSFDNGQTDEGRVYVYEGTSTGLDPVPAAILEVDIAFLHFGWSVAGAGDINHDGYDDIIIGAISYDNGEIDEGAVFVYYGSVEGIIEGAYTILESNNAHAYFGVSVSDAGDVNGDEFDDIVVGAMYYSNGESSEGAGFVFHGSAAGIVEIPAVILESNQYNAQLGLSVSSAGDINGDAYDDIIFGAHYFNDDQADEGGAFIYEGSPTGIQEESLFILEHNSDSTHFGVSVSDLGDINSDGVDDVVVGAEWYSTDTPYSGGAFLYMHKPCDSVFYQDNDHDGFGDPFSTVIDCILPAGYVSDNNDCNDSNNLIFPGSTEICNSLDDDCDGTTDEEITESISISAGGATTFCQGGNVLLSAIYSGVTIQWKKNGSNIPGATSANYTATKTGTYTCVTISPCGTATSTEILITVKPNPPAAITAGGATTFCMGGSVVLSANAGGGLGYQWYKGASAIVGATLINYTATLPGNYKCRVTKTATGCFKNSNVITVTVPCKEDEEQSNNLITNNSITVYPNPANDKLNIEIGTGNQELGTKTNSAIVITDVTGKIISSSEIKTSTTQINISNYAVGMYFITVTVDGIQFTEKFIKE